MILSLKIDNEIADNKELLTQFHPDYEAETNVIIRNDKTPVIRMIQKNSNLLSMIEELDLEVI